MLGWNGRVLYSSSTAASAGRSSPSFVDFQSATGSNGSGCGKEEMEFQN